jgi:hypothetical protein
MHRITSVNFVKIVLGVALKIKYRIGNSDALKLTFRINTPFTVYKKLSLEPEPEKYDLAAPFLLSPTRVHFFAPRPKRVLYCQICIDNQVNTYSVFLLLDSLFKNLDVRLLLFEKIPRSKERRLIQISSERSGTVNIIHLYLFLII